MRRLSPRPVRKRLRRTTVRRPLTTTPRRTSRSRSTQSHQLKRGAPTGAPRRLIRNGYEWAGCLTARTPRTPGGSTRSRATSGVEDVWALPTPGGPDDFPLLVEALASGDPERRAPPASPARCGRSAGSSASCSAGTTRTPASAPGCRRCATGCRPTCATGRPGPSSTTLPFTPLYLLDDECAAEVANKTVHGVMHLGWVSDGSGRLPRPDGGAREAERPVRQRLHGRDQAVPAPDRVPADDAPDSVAHGGSESEKVPRDDAGGVDRADDVGRAAGHGRRAGSAAGDRPRLPGLPLGARPGRGAAAQRRRVRRLPALGRAAGDVHEPAAALRRHHAARVRADDRRTSTATTRTPTFGAMPGGVGTQYSPRPGRAGLPRRASSAWPTSTATRART